MLQELIYHFAFSDFLRFECIDQPFKALGCLGFWFNYTVIVEILLLFIVYKTVKHVLSNRKSMKAFYQRQARKAMIADRLR